MKTCLVLGARGMLGSAVMSHVGHAAARGEITLLGFDLPEVDIADGGSVSKLFASVKPNVVINCAAYTDVDGAESASELAFHVNAAGAEILAHAARGAGALLVHISTDFIFDGASDRPYREDDAPNPLSVYGKTKLLGEAAVIKVAPEHLVIRTAWLYGPGGGNFVDTLLGLAPEKGRLRVVNDQLGSPTCTLVLAPLVWKLVTRGARGIFHVAGQPSCTWFDLATEAVTLASIECEIEPVTTREFPRPAERPANSALDCAKVEAFLGEELPHWREGLRLHLKR